ncbi:hypothetical protein R3W88_012713 [Solanum pinnatisectum]|uniref:Uncharacterized protein n=1 Tax=Solanum pinnatisectum TaxID=50273 RepID=A0AAV9LDD7_9SOLN|nr:hypothetical protein R3W88_012713 [Solanum pinnatisectum]
MASALETLCGQAYGAKKHHMLGIYMQRSWIVITLCCILLLPMYIFATPILKALGQPDDVAELSGVVALWFIPLQFSFAFQFTIQRFLQSLKTAVIAWISLAVLAIHTAISWLFVYKLNLGIVGAAVALDISWWLLVVGLFKYAACGGCPETWSGFSIQAFSGLWEFFKLSAAAGVMLCLENWYYRILILMAGYLQNSTLTVDALSICMNINSWEMVIPLRGEQNRTANRTKSRTEVRVANELGAGRGKAAKFAAVISVIYSTMIGLVFCILIMIDQDKFALFFSSNFDVLKVVKKISYLLTLTILLNSVQPVLSVKVAYINLGCYYLVGVPLGILMGMGLWAGMIFGGTALQTILLAFIAYRSYGEKEASKARMHVEKLSEPPPVSQS